MRTVRLTKDWEGKPAGTVVTISEQEYCFPWQYNLEYEEVTPTAKPTVSKPEPEVGKNGG